MSMLQTSRARATAPARRAGARRVCRRVGWPALLAGLAILPTALAQAPPPTPPPPAAQSVPAPAAIQELGKDRYRIGTIVVDRKAGRFSVPGRILHIDDAPLEYIAVGRGGYKGYESLLELDTIGTEFNLACILLGLDASAVRRPEYQFDRRPPEGPPVMLEVRWQADGKTVTVPMRDALKIAAAPPGAPSAPGEAGAAASLPDEWVYTGSFNTGEDRRYAADVIGTLIGFVHDPASVIEHRSGLGIGAYGSVQGNAKVLPPVGAAVELVVSVPGGKR
jgi:hypothetical protein